MTMQDSAKIRLCETCKATNFSILPSENEPGFPHKLSLEALKKSAATCSLCELIQQAVDDLFQDIEIERRSERNPSLVISPKLMVQDITYGHAAWVFFEKSQGGPVRRTQFGVHVPQGLGKLRSGQESNPVSVESGDTDNGVLRPWLYGNWWMLERPREGMDAVHQLVGIGVRVSRTPNIADAEGNSSEMIFYRGSQLRVYTNDGKIKPPMNRTPLRLTFRLSFLVLDSKQASNTEFYLITGNTKVVYVVKGM
jgi:hypothetical protein